MAAIVGTGSLGVEHDRFGAPARAALAASDFTAQLRDPQPFELSRDSGEVREV